MELREKINYIIDDRDAHFTSGWVTTDRILKAIKEAGWVQLDENQELPLYSYSWAMKYFKHSGDEYQKAQQDMKDNHWKKVKED